MLTLRLVKLRRPRPTHELVRRPRLIAKLNAGLDLPITLLSASAGFGKTTVLLEWLDGVSLPVAWVSLEESDNTLEFFTSYLITAIRTVFPGALDSILGLLAGPVSPKPERLADALSNEIAALPDKFILVLDDLHLISSPDVQAMMGALVRHLPACLHLVIATRHDVPLPLAKLRASGQISELRSSDLRFTDAEMQELLARLLNRNLPPEALRVLEQAVEGWIAGIWFAALALRAGTSEQDLIKIAAKPNNRQMKDYFLNEMLLQQSPATQEFLLKTSLLERFTPEACESLMGGESGENWRAIFNQLVRDEVMVTALDETEGWYRYHPLFRDFLRSGAKVTYGAGTITELNRRASRWHAAQGYFTEAIQHALAAGDIADAAELVGIAVRQEMDRETARHVLEYWLGLFRVHERDRHLGLVMAQLWQAALQIRLPAAAKLIPLAERLAAEGQDRDAANRSHYLGEIGYFKLARAFFANQPARVLEMGPEILINLPQTSVNARGNTLNFMAVSHQMMGQSAIGLGLLAEAQETDAGSSSNLLVRLLLGRAWVQMYESDYEGVLETATRMLESAGDTSYLTLGFSHYLLGTVRYEWNQLQAAAQHFALSAELRFSANAKPCHESFAWLALTQQAQGLSETADVTMHEVLRFSDRVQSSDLAASSEAYRGQLALMQARTGAALRWAESVSLSPAPHMFWDIEHHLIRQRALLAARKSELAQTALAETNALLEFALSFYNRRRAIQLYALQAMALDALGQTNRALDALQRSIELAERGGFKRTFSDLGPRMARLLSLLLARNVAPTYVKSILPAFPEIGQDVVYDAGAENGKGRLIEPLTLREMQVLEGLAKRMTTKEIAASLVISPLTVKTHIDHIFSKLNVNKRNEATQVAVAYGLIEKPTKAPSALEPF